MSYSQTADHSLSGRVTKSSQVMVFEGSQVLSLLYCPGNERILSLELYHLQTSHKPILGLPRPFLEK